jgi:hypothetical protein
MQSAFGSSVSSVFDQGASPAFAASATVPFGGESSPTYGGLENNFNNNSFVCGDRGFVGRGLWGSVQVEERRARVPTTISDPSSGEAHRLWHICAHPELEHFSPDELRCGGHLSDQHSNPHIHQHSHQHSNQFAPRNDNENPFAQTLFDRPTTSWTTQSPSFAAQSSSFAKQSSSFATQSSYFDTQFATQFATQSPSFATQTAFEPSTSAPFFTTQSSFPATQSSFPATQSSSFTTQNTFQPSTTSFTTQSPSFTTQSQFPSFTTQSQSAFQPSQSAFQTSKTFSKPSKKPINETHLSSSALQQPSVFQHQQTPTFLCATTINLQQRPTLCEDPYGLRFLDLMSTHIKIAEASAATASVTAASQGRRNTLPAPRSVARLGLNCRRLGQFLANRSDNSDRLIQCELPMPPLVVVTMSTESAQSDAIVGPIESGVETDKKTEMDEKHTTSSIIPTIQLTSPELSTLPPWVKLQTMTETELKTVPNFRLKHEQFGFVRWMQPVDLCGVNLDDLVEFEQGAATLVLSRSKLTSGLSGPATVTLLGCWPDPSIDMNAHKAKLTDICHQTGTDFLGYDQTAGAWSFLVSSFLQHAVL